MNARRLLMRRDHRRRAAAVVQVAVTATLTLGMAALAVDVGILYTAQSQIQVSADAAALAAAAELGGTGNVEAAALAAADQYAGANKVWGMTPKVWPEDIEFGRALLDSGTGKFDFDPGGDRLDALRVTVRHQTPTIPNKRVTLTLPLAFANIFGIADSTLRARATAVLVPRDIAVVIDLSNSMCWDSQLRFWSRSDGGYSNLRDIWCALDGPEPARPYIPGSPLESEYASDTGPTFGWMTDWGHQLIPGSYSASSDPGLWYIKKSSTTSVTAINTKLSAEKYTSAEQTAIKSGSRDGTASHWRNRCGVMLGLAKWKSGKTGAAYPGGGNGDDVLDNSEMVWIAKPSWAKDWGWTNYIDWVQSHYLSAFKYRYGLKTFTDFLMENQPEKFSTDNLWQTPEQPLRAIKDSVQTMIDTVSAQEGLDQVSLEVFATTGRHELDLTNAYQDIADRLYVRQSGHYDRTTNIGGGLARAIDELGSSRARDAAVKFIVLMSDGVPNVDGNGNNLSDGAPAAVNYAYSKAQEAADAGAYIFCVSVGVGVDRTVMQNIAEIGNGQEFYATGTPAEYSAQLEQIFKNLGGKRPVRLIN